MKEKIIESLKKVRHPELGVDIVTAGMVSDIEIKENKISFTITYKKPVDPLSNSIKRTAIATDRKSVV